MRWKEEGRRVEKGGKVKGREKKRREGCLSVSSYTPTPPPLYAVVCNRKSNGCLIHGQPREWGRRALGIMGNRVRCVSQDILRDRHHLALAVLVRWWGHQG